MESFVASVRADLSGVELNVGSLVRVGVSLAARVNTIIHLSGEEKKELIVKSLMVILEEKKVAAMARTNGSTETVIEFTVLEATVKMAIPAAIEAAISAARGGLNLKKFIPPRVWSCFSSAAAIALKDATALREELKAFVPQPPAAPSAPVAATVAAPAEVVLSEVVVVEPEVVVVVPEVLTAVPEDAVVEAAVAEAAAEPAAVQPPVSEESTQKS
jgi:hypothetical protein